MLCSRAIRTAGISRSGRSAGTRRPTTRSMPPRRKTRTTSITRTGRTSAAMTAGRLRRVGRSTHTKVWGIAALTGTSAQGGRKISRTQTRKEQDDVLETDALARRRIRAVRRRTRRPGYKFHPRVDGVRRTRDRFFGSFQLRRDFDQILSKLEGTRGFPRGVQWSCGFAELLEGVEKMSGDARLPAG